MDATNARDCWHGQLARACDRCADAAEIVELRAEIERLTAQDVDSLLAVNAAQADELENLRWELDATKRAREHVEAAAKRLLAALARMDKGAANPGFRGWQNGHGEEVGDEAQDAREALARLLAGPNCSVEQSTTALR